MAPAQQGVVNHTYVHPLPGFDILPPVPAPEVDQDVFPHWAMVCVQRIAMCVVEYVAPLLVEQHPVAEVGRPEIMRLRPGAQPSTVAAPPPPPYAHHQAQDIHDVYRVRPGRALCVMVVAIVIFAPLLSITHVSAADLTFSVDEAVEIVMGEAAAAQADQLSRALVLGMELVASEPPWEGCAA